MRYQGSCHCGNVAFDVEGQINSAMSCNCSMCARKASLLWFVPRSAFTLRTPDGAARTYEFYKHAVRHRFCPMCGIHPYAEAEDSNGKPTVAINLNCVEGIDLKTIPVKQFDGRSL